MKILKLKISALKAYEGNAKKHPKWQIEQIIKSIKEFGFNDPIAVDENNVVIEGHGRLEALSKMGAAEVECIRLSHLTKEQKTAYIIAHNKITMNTGYDDELLKKELEKLELKDFDLELTGFNESELEIMFQDEDEGEELTKKVEFEVKEKTRANGYICPGCGQRHLKEKFEAVEI